MYENDVLQFAPQEEGRIRFKPATANTAAGFVFDYFIKDHLGNVRVVLTEEQKVDQYPAATMETAQAATEELFYANLPATRTDKPPGYPTDNTTSPNDKVAKTNGNGNKIGPSIILKVMAGDKFNVKVSSWYRTNGATPNTPVNPLPDLLAALINGVSGVSASGGHKVTAAELQGSGALTPGTTNFLNNQTNNTNSSKPQAYLNWILFDEQFNLVSSSSGFEQVGNNEEFKLHVKNDMPVDKCGYLYVYVSNNTPNIDVYFDNLQVTHTRGAMLETNQFYPFGLKMSAISYSAAGGMKNKNLYNGKELQSNEFSDGTGLEAYDFGKRMYDQQTGHFDQIDPLADKMRRFSPYSHAFDNPLRFIDPDGMAPDDVVITGPEKQKAFGELQKSVNGQLNLSMNTKGEVTYTNIAGVSPNINAQKLATAIDDHSILVKVDANNTNTTSENKQFSGGAFMGNHVALGPNLPGGKSAVLANQEINPNVLEKVSTFYNTPGNEVLHEVTEAYTGAKISQAAGVSSPSSAFSGSVYTSAHAPSSTTVPQNIIYADNRDANGNPTGDLQRRGGTSRSWVGDGTPTGSLVVDQYIIK